MSVPSLHSKLDEFQQVWNSRYELLRRWKEEGRTIFGYCYCDVPLEIVHAAGILPIQFTESADTRHHELGTSESADYFCDHAQYIIGQGLDGVYAPLDGVIFAHSCETMRMVASVWELQVPLRFFYFMPTAMKRNETNRTFLSAEYLALRKAIEHFVGHKITPAKLRASIEVYNTNRALVRKLYQLRFERGLDLSEAELNTVIRAGWVMPAERHNRMLEGLLSEGSEAGSPEQTLKPRIMLSGFSPEHCMTARLNVADILEKDLGARVVIDDFARGHRYNWSTVEAQKSPLEALVDGYMGKSPVSFRQTSAQEAERLLSMAKSYGAQGAVILVPKFCTDFLFQLPHLESEFERNGIPVLRLETESLMPEGQLRTRLGAFVEMLEGSMRPA